MNTKRKIIAIVMVVSVILSFAAMQSAAVTSINYSTGTHKKIGSYHNSAASTRYFHINNTYSSGNSDVWLSVENSSGTTVYGRKQFSRFITQSDLVVSCPANTTRYFWVKPATTGYTVSGTYDYSVMTTA